MVWQFNSSGVYSSKSLYKIINFRGIKTIHVSAAWRIKIPPRVYFFLWLLINNRVLAKQCWFVISEIVGSHVGESIVELGKFWLSDKNLSMINMVKFVVLWSI